MPEFGSHFYCREKARAQRQSNRHWPQKISNSSQAKGHSKRAIIFSFQIYCYFLYYASKMPYLSNLI